MCGIVGFTGSAQAAPILLDGLSKLEYRGYDSAGMAVQNAAGKIEVVKAKGRLKVLSEMTDGGSAVPGSCGIGHTRWATHGEPSVVNAHPHYSRDQKIAVVHNGIIENYQEMKERLINKGFNFVSQTDTEVVAQLLDYYYMGESAGDALDAITRMMLHVVAPTRWACSVCRRARRHLRSAQGQPADRRQGRGRHHDRLRRSRAAQVHPHGLLH